MTIFTKIHPVKIEKSDRTNCVSHLSYETPVVGCCHHTGDYLTAAEIEPTQQYRFWISNEFPGLPKINKAFRDAFHQKKSHHLEIDERWLLPIALLLFAIGSLIFSIDYRVNLQTINDLPNLLFFWLYLFGFSFFLLLTALAILFDEKLYHNILSIGRRPKLYVYPLDCSYEVEAIEKLTVNLDNSEGLVPEVKQQDCQLKVTVHPAENNWESIVDYAQKYRLSLAHLEMFAGIVSLNRLSAVQFPNGDSRFEYDHRINLRFPYQSPSRRRRSKPSNQLIYRTPYKINFDQLESNKDDPNNFPLVCTPKIAPNNSRQLNIEFEWKGKQKISSIPFCQLEIPDELGSVIYVKLGHYDKERCIVTWNNLKFKENQLTLTLHFEKPVLTYKQKICGQYKVELDDLYSEMTIDPSHIWDVLGHRVKSSQSMIRLKTDLSGDLIIDPQRLSQAHEYVTGMSINAPIPPSEEIVQTILNVLLSEGFDVLRVAKQFPRLDPLGNLNKALLYWDIFTRRYSKDLMESFDLHLIVSGYTQAESESEFTPEQSGMAVDLRIRCLHDPRNKALVQFVKESMEAKDSATGMTLYEKIQQTITNSATQKGNNLNGKQANDSPDFYQNPTDRPLA